MNRFSIILPVRNGGEYVKECVGSILSQDYPGDFNLIVLDNASTDSTVPWLRSLNDTRITIHTSSRSLTIVENWARIKDVPKNEFITLIGHDDILAPGYLAVMHKLIEANSAATLYQAHFNYIGKSGEFIRACKPFPKSQTSADFLKDNSRKLKTAQAPVT